jgi:hypothetical protein
MFIVTTYKGKTAILDTLSRVYYFNFKSRNDAIKQCAELNKP